MRPYAGTPLRPDMTAQLYVMRDIMRPKAWRLCWATPNSDSYCMNEGECSAVYHPTMRAAVAYGERHYGERHYGERAKRAPWSD